MCVFCMHACLCVLCEIGSCYVAQAILKFVNLLPHSLSDGITDVCHIT